MSRRRTLIVVAPLLFACPTALLGAQTDSVALAPPPVHSTMYWQYLSLGFATSILLHEAAHVATAYAVGGHPSFGFDKLRPTIFSGVDSHLSPHRQFLFSAAGLTLQNLIDEAVLDIPHARGSAFERGILAGGVGTTLFYLTIGRNGSVSDVDFMARTHALTKTQVTLIYGSVAALHIVRIASDAHYANFFAQPSTNGLDVGVDVTGW